MKLITQSVLDRTFLVILVIFFGIELPLNSTFGQVETGGLIVDSTATRLTPGGGKAIYTTAFHNLAFDDQAKRIAVGQGTGRVFIWDLENHELQHQFQAHTNWAFSVRFFADGKRLATGGGDNQVKLWNLQDLSKPSKVFTRHTGDVHSVLLSRRETAIITAGDDMTPLIEQLNSGATSEKSSSDKQPSYRVLEKHPRQIPAMALSGNGRILATASRDGKIRIFEYKSGDLMFTLDGHQKDCITVRFVPNTMNIVTGGYDGTIAVWNANMGYLINRFEKHDGAVVCVDPSPDGSTVVSIDDRTLLFNSLDNPQEDPVKFSPEIASDEQLSFVRFHPDGHQLFVTTTLGRVLIIDREKMQVVKILTAPDPPTASDSKKTGSAPKHGESDK